MTSSRIQTSVRLSPSSSISLGYRTHPRLAQKYKSYNKLRDILSGKLPPPSKPTQSPSRKRKSAASSTSHAAAAAQTPSSKRLRTTPSLARTVHLETTTTPSLNRRLFLSPASAKAPTPTSIGPTPQRDGRVLGLFDLLSGGEEETPSRPRTGDFLVGGDGAAAAPQLAATPRKGGRGQNERGEGEEDLGRGGVGLATTPATAARRLHGRTPMSTSKRAMLDHFLLFTPLKNRDGNAATTNSFAARIGIAPAAVSDKENGGGAALATTPKGPGSVSKGAGNLFATPAFLKRGHKPLDAVDESGEVEEVRPLRLPRKPLVRGLSSVVAGLRKLEEEKLDDEMEAMREAEMDMEGMPPPAKRQKVDGPVGSETGAAEGESVAVGDSQATDRPALLGGFDDENLLDSDVEEQLDRGQPLRVYKKKGQKRTTRRVNMRPTRARRPAERPEGQSEDEDEEVVPETQANAAYLGEEEDLDALSGSDAEEAEVRNGKTAKAKGDRGKDSVGDGNKKEGTVKKAVRKVKATANANFKRLKLKNYGAKGGPGVNSRFRRRR